MNKKIRKAIFERSKGRCECGCGYSVTYETGRADHFFGRAKAVESVETVWFLSVPCDEGKTSSRPSAVMWCDRFYIHAIAHGYHEVAERAATKVRVLIAKGFGGPQNFPAQHAPTTGRRVPPPPAGGPFPTPERG